MGLGDKWIGWINWCISSTSFACLLIVLLRTFSLLPEDFVKAILSHCSFSSLLWRFWAGCCSLLLKPVWLQILLFDGQIRCSWRFSISFLWMTWSFSVMSVSKLSISLHFCLVWELTFLSLPFFQLREVDNAHLVGKILGFGLDSFSSSYLDLRLGEKFKENFT